MRGKTHSRRPSISNIRTILPVEVAAHPPNEWCTARSRNALHDARRWQRDPTETEVRARMMKVLIGVDPHKGRLPSR